LSSCLEVARWSAPANCAPLLRKQTGGIFGQPCHFCIHPVDEGEEEMKALKSHIGK